MRLFLGWIALGVIGCGSRAPDVEGTDTSSVGDSGNVTNDSGIQDTDDEETGSTEEPLVPEQGNYLGVPNGDWVDECGFGSFDEAAESPVEFWFELVGTDMSVLLISDGSYVEGPNPCVFSDNTFSCVVMEEQTSSEDLEAIVTTTIAFRGEWTDSVTIDADYEVSAECEGADCDKYLQTIGFEGPMPCISSIGIAAQWTENEPVLPVEPKEGNYKATLGGVSGDTCGLEKETAQQIVDQQVLYFELGQRLSVRLEDSGREVATSTCTISGPNFDCSLLEIRNENKDYDAVLVQTVDAFGEWVAPDEMSGTYEIAFDCEGSQCAEALKQSQSPYPIPCAVGFSFTGR